jgi:glycosyltransferase involved in cell wall biosynthesis
VHTPHGHAFHDYLGAPASAALQAVERGLTRWTDQVICLTDGERGDYLDLRIGPPERFVIIHSGVDVDRFRRRPPQDPARRSALGLPTDGPLVGCVARLVPVKGVHVLLEAVPQIRAAVPGATLVFVGDGPLRAELERRSESLGLNGATVFLGLRHDIAELLPLFDVLVLPSLNEGMGRVVVEAQASGRPVVASRVGGIQDLVTHGQTGLLVPPADANALSSAIIECLTNPALAESLARQARAGVDAYGIAPMISEIDRLYVRLLRERTSNDARLMARSVS